MLDQLSDDIYIRLVEAAEWLNISPNVLLAMLRDKRTVKVFVENFITFEKSILMEDNYAKSLLPETHNMRDVLSAYVPLGPLEIERIRAEGSVCLRSWEVPTPPLPHLSPPPDGQSYACSEAYVLKPNFSKTPPDPERSFSLDSLLISVAVAKQIRNERTWERPPTDNHAPTLVGQKAILAFFDPVSWNTVKGWILAHDGTPPERGEQWTISVEMAATIKAAKASLYRAKKKKRK